MSLFQISCQNDTLNLLKKNQQVQQFMTNLKKQLRRLCATGLLAFTIAGCQADPAASETKQTLSEPPSQQPSSPLSAPAANLTTKCDYDPEIKFCTMQYEPVCGVLKSGEEKTFSNSCVACTNENVTGYREGECQASKLKSRQ